MKPQFRILEYFCITGLVWALYLLWLIPFQIFWIRLSTEQFITWVFHGTILEMIFSYPIAKVITKIAPKITLYFSEFK